MAIELGKKYKETVHGREGIAISKTEYHTGCNRVLLEYLDSDREVKEFIVDEMLLVDVKDPPPPPPESQIVGGPGKVAAKPNPVPR